MTGIDWAIIVVYMIGCTVAGLWMRRYVRNVDEFAVAARQMEVNLGVASLAATEVGIVTVMYTAQMGFKSGFAGATPGILTAFAMLVVGITGFVIVPLRNARVMTIPELFEKRFGKKVRWLAGLVVIIGGVLNMGVFLRAGGEFLMHITGMDPTATVQFNILGVAMPFGYLELIMTGLLAVVLLYTVLGGMLSVLITDYLQFLVMGLGIVVTSVLVIHSFGWSEIITGPTTAYEAGAEYGKSAKAQAKIVEQAAEQIEKDQGKAAAEAFRKAQGEKKAQELRASAKTLAAEQKVLVGTKPPPRSRDAERALPVAETMAYPLDPTQSDEMGWAWVIWQAIMGFAVVTTWQTTVARVLAARDAQTAKRVYRGTWFYFVGRWCLPGMWGVAAFLYFTNHGGLPEGVDDWTAMPRYLGILLSEKGMIGFLGLMIAAMLAAEMSTDSGYLLTWATVIYNDLISPCLRRPLSERGKLRTVRAVVLVIGVFLVFWGLWYEPPGSVWEYLAITGNIYLASLFALLVGGLYWRGANTWGAIAAIVLGAAGPVTFLIVNFFYPKSVGAAWSGLAAFGFAAAGMVVGSLLGARFGAGRPLGEDFPPPPSGNVTAEEAAS